MKNGTIKNILFDLGGVLLDLDKKGCFDAFKDLGVDLSSNGLGYYGQTGLLGELELGLVGEDDFYHRFRQEFNTKLGDETIKNAWNRFLVGIPQERLKFLKQLKNRYALFLLSNTSKIHHDYWQPMFRYNEAEAGAHHYFDAVYCSFDSHVAKPDKKAFEKVIQHSGIKPGETLFFDDSEANIDSAEKLGFKTVLVREGEKLEQIYIDKLL